MNWDDLRFYLAVARDGSLSAAASRLRTTPSRVSRHVEALEQALGQTLFRRSLEGYSLTDEGRALLPRAEAVEGAVQALDAAGAPGVAGRVRLATTENIAAHLLARPLRRMQAQHPDLRLELLASSSAVDLMAAEADVALRLLRPSRGNLTLRRLGQMGFAVYGAAEGPVAEGFISWMPDMADLPAVRWIERSGAPVVMQASSLSVQHQLAAAGAGQAVLPCFLGDPDPRLRRIGGLIPEAAQDIWLVTNRDLAGSARVRCVADTVAAAIKQQLPLLEGRSSDAAADQG